MDASGVNPQWTVVVPVKRAEVGKSRLRVDGIPHPALARAIALDTIAAIADCRRVVRVVVVTDDAVTTGVLRSMPRVGAVKDDGGGLGAAIGYGLDAVPVSRARAVMLGDLPALHPRELEVALEMAARHPLAFVPDADGTGSVLATALPGIALRPRFGGPSAYAHHEAGFAELALPADWGLRRDLDHAEHLPDLHRRGLGPRTAALLAAAPLALAS